MGRGARAANALCFVVGCVVALAFVDVRPECPRERRGGVRFACVVLTAPENADRRDAIRRTWLKLADGSDVVFRHYFAIGSESLDAELARRLSVERETYGDLLLVPVVDDYSTLATKLLLALSAINDELAPDSYVIKADDDSFVRLDRTIAELEARRDGRHLYWGYFKGNARVRREGKWGESEWALCDRYLPYALGGGYVLSGGVVAFVARNAAALRTYRSEDVTVGAWTAPLADVERRHDVRFDTEWTSRGCDDSLLIRHKQTTESMAEMYSNLVRSSGAELCTEVRSLRPSYRYDWSVPPSLCCVPKKSNTVD